MKWHISVVVWGDYHTDAFCNVALPCLQAALKESPGTEARFIVHTDESTRNRLEEALADLPHDTVVSDIAGALAEHDNPWGKHKVCADLTQADINSVPYGDCIALTVPDGFVSKEMFATSEAAFSEGYRLVLVDGVRVRDVPPVGLSASELNDWSMINLHPVTMDCFWGHGRSSNPGTIYFAVPGSVIAHGFSVHPLCLVKDRPLTCTTGIEADLLNHYEQNEIFVASKSQITMVSLTPKDFPMHRLSEGWVMSEGTVAVWAKENVRHKHRWLFQRPLVVYGDRSDNGGGEICQRILDLMDTPNFGWHSVGLKVAPR